MEPSSKQKLNILYVKNNQELKKAEIKLGNQYSYRNLTKKPSLHLKFAIKNAKFKEN